MFALGPGVALNRGQSRSRFSPASLFSAGEQGVFYDPSDLTTLYQDAAGTTPVTAVEQPVGRMLDKSGRGNHATQSTAASRPVLSAKVNLLTKTEAFDDAVWGKISGGASSALPVVTPNAAVAPDGTLTADRVVFTAGADYSLLTSGSVAAAANSLFSLYVQSATGLSQQLVIYWSDGSINRTAVSVPATGWARVTLSITSAATDTVKIGVRRLYYPDVTAADVYIWGADLRVANDGIGLPVYQRVNTATDYDSGPEWPRFLRFDGVDDSMSTGSINFTSTAQMSVFAGVRKLSDSGIGMIAELSADSNTANGTMMLFSAPSDPTGYYWRSKGTVAADVAAGTYTAPSTHVLTGQGEIATPVSRLRVNGSTLTPTTTTQGTGNFGNHPLHIGRRGGSTLPFNGRLYGLTIVGKSASADEITKTETWLNAKVKAY